MSAEEKRHADHAHARMLLLAIQNHWLKRGHVLTEGQDIWIEKRRLYGMHHDVSHLYSVKSTMLNGIPTNASPDTLRALQLHSK